MAEIYGFDGTGAGTTITAPGGTSPFESNDGLQMYKTWPARRGRPLCRRRRGPAVSGLFSNVVADVADGATLTSTNGSVNVLANGKGDDPQLWNADKYIVTADSHYFMQYYKDGRLQQDKDGNVQYLYYDSGDKSDGKVYYLVSVSGSSYGFATSPNGAASVTATEKTSESISLPGIAIIGVSGAFGFAGVGVLAASLDVFTESTPRSGRYRLGKRRERFRHEQLRHAQRVYGAAFRRRGRG